MDQNEALKVLQNDKDIRVLPDPRFGGWRIMASFEGVDERVDRFVELHNITNMEFICSDLTDDGLRRLATIKTLRRLEMSKAKFTGRGLAALKDLPQLEELQCGPEDHVAEGMAAVGQIVSLKRLDWTSSPVTSEMLPSLRGLKKLERLNLTCTEVARGFDALKDCRKLEKLILEDAPVDDIGAAQIAELSQIKSLTVCGTRITDEGMKSLCRMRGLMDLAVYSTGVTTSGMNHISGLTVLESLDLDGYMLDQHIAKQLTKLSLKKIYISDKNDPHHVRDLLRKSLPECRVNWYMDGDPEYH